jgi:ABC-type branched-subunit amino acid transport system ATPase component
VSDRGARSAPLLKTELLTVRFGGLAALSQINFEVRRDEVRAIIGPNGAGKSTFFNCLTGVLRPTSGRILFDGDDITGLLLPDHQHPAERQRAGKRAHRRAIAPACLEHGFAPRRLSRH